MPLLCQILCHKMNEKIIAYINIYTIHIFPFILPNNYARNIKINFISIQYKYRNLQMHNNSIGSYIMFAQNILSIKKKKLKNNKKYLPD